MKKQVWVLIMAVLCLLFNSAHSQKRAYIQTDSSLSGGIELIPNTRQFNSQYIKVKVKNGEITYTPEQLAEYGFDDGTVYQSKEMEIDGERKKVFLERIAVGKITLFRYRDTRNTIYYVTRDSSDLYQLQKDLRVMKELSLDCEFMMDAIRLASYSGKSLQKLVSHYNVCKNKPFPYSKFGLLAGWRNAIVSQGSKENSDLKDVSFPSSSSPVIGIFGDIPIVMSEFSLHPELFYSWNDFVSNTHTAQADIDVLISIRTLQMPILVRYTAPAINWRLFFDVGPNFAYHIENSSDIYIGKMEGNMVLIERPSQEKLLADFMFGYSAGVGLQKKLNYRKTLSAEFKFTKSMGADDDTFSLNALNLVIGFTF